VDDLQVRTEEIMQISTRLNAGRMDDASVTELNCVADLPV